MNIIQANSAIPANLSFHEDHNTDKTGAAAFFKQFSSNERISQEDLHSTIEDAVSAKIFSETPSVKNWVKDIFLTIELQDDEAEDAIKENLEDISQVGDSNAILILGTAYQIASGAGKTAFASEFASRIRSLIEQDPKLAAIKCENAELDLHQIRPDFLEQLDKRECSNKTEQSSWITRHKTITALGLLVLMGIGAAVYFAGDHAPLEEKIIPDQSEAPLMDDLDKMRLEITNSAIIPKSEKEPFLGLVEGIKMCASAPEECTKRITTMLEKDNAAQEAYGFIVRSKEVFSKILTHIQESRPFDNETIKEFQAYFKQVLSATGVKQERSDSPAHIEKQLPMLELFDRLLSKIKQFPPFSDFRAVNELAELVHLVHQLTLEGIRNPEVVKSLWPSTL
jgi:hypothetical protein